VSPEPVEAALEGVVLLEGCRREGDHEHAGQTAVTLVEVGHLWCSGGREPALVGGEPDLVVDVVDATDRTADHVFLWPRGLHRQARGLLEI
jgi:hypothetical protein